jgi:hypothetical protein
MLETQRQKEQLEKQLLELQLDMLEQGHLQAPQEHD